MLNYFIGYVLGFVMGVFVMFSSLDDLKIKYQSRALTGNSDIVFIENLKDKSRYWKLKTYTLQDYEKIIEFEKD